MKTIFYNPKNRAKALTQIFRKEKKNWGTDRHVLLIFDSNDETSIIIAEKLETEDSWDRVINFKGFQLLCSTDFNVKKEKN